LLPFSLSGEKKTRTWASALSIDCLRNRVWPPLAIMDGATVDPEKRDPAAHLGNLFAVQQAL
jgi:hypothetical protein